MKEILRKLRIMKLLSKFKDLLKKVKPQDINHENMSYSEYKKWERDKIFEFVKRLAIITFLLGLVSNIIFGYILYNEWIKVIPKIINSFENDNFKIWLVPVLKSLILKLILTICILFTLFFLIAIFIIIIIYSKIGMMISDKIENFIENRLSLEDSIKKDIQKFNMRYYKVTHKRATILALIIFLSFVGLSLIVTSIKKLSINIVPLLAFIGIACFILYTTYYTTKVSKEIGFGRRNIRTFMKLSFYNYILIIFRILAFFYLIVPLIIFVAEILLEKIRDIFFERIFLDFFSKVISESNRLGISHKSELPDVPKMTFFTAVSFLKEISIYLPYLFLLIILIIVFGYIIPYLYIGGIKYRRLKTFLLSFFLGVIITKIVYWSIPRMFLLDPNYLFYGILLALIAYISGEMIEKEVEDLSEEGRVCRKCKKENPLEAEFCMFCGTDLRKKKLNKK